jgi:hypothetical protein
MKSYSEIRGGSIPYEEAAYSPQADERIFILASAGTHARE